MAKRFTDTGKFKDPWYRKLSPIHKCIWEFVLSECDHAGFLEIDLESMSFHIGSEITQKDLEFFGDRFNFVKDDLIFIPKFIKYQYGELNPENKVHKSVLKVLEKHNIKPLGSPLLGAKDKDKDKIKDKEINNSFNEFYLAYPRKESKGKAETAYQNALKDGATQEMLLDGVKRYCKHIKKEFIDRQFIKQPATWLNQKCWEDRYTVDIPKSTSNITQADFKPVKKTSEELEEERAIMEEGRRLLRETANKIRGIK